MKTLFVFNPASGKGVDKEQVLETLKSRLDDMEFKIMETNEKFNSNRILEALKGNEYERLLIGGGDGTINMISQAVLNAGIKINIGIIPLGSANGLAKCLGIEDIPMAIQAIEDNSVNKVDALSVNGNICLHLSDFGFNAGLIKKFEKEDERGMISYFKSSLKQFLEMKPYRFTLKMKKEEFSVQAHMLVIANGDRYGTGAVINPKGRIDDGKFEVISINIRGLDEILSLSLALFNGQIDKLDHVRIWSCTEAEIQNHDDAEFQIDGELQKTTKIATVNKETDQLSFYGFL
ncbi:MAG: diacylglycerol kinase family protein [Bacteroides sp.]|jgi:YegS/Rv2252/BmrU family lipid kinase|nr:diacylglycerol kinase family protein [Bacteroides sp.]